jgi:uncharacterized protein (TIGR00299 family) protein
MRALILDPFSGAAGDMIVGALLDCGADRDRVVRAMGSVVEAPVITTVTRCGIRGVKVDTRADPASRTIETVLARCNGADAPAEARAMAERVFLRIAAAEEEVHGAHTHFHEVGADDAIADVIGACTALSTLAVDGVAVLPVPLGAGMVRTAHGIFPVPAPATVQILKGSGITARAGGSEGELCTPTGAALLAEFSTLREPDLGMYTISAVGYGAGTRDPVEIPNVLRAMVVETGSLLMQHDRVDVLETNVDDVSGELIGNAIALFMENGARDASATPLIMKKGRAGYLVSVICTRDKRADLAALMARELGTLGIRCTSSVHRFVARRTDLNVEVVILGQKKTLPVKCGWMGDTLFSLKPEFEPARAWAKELDVPVRSVLQAVTDAGWRALGKSPGARHEK